VVRRLAEAPVLTPKDLGAPLVYVRMDGFVERCRRRGRFALSRGEAACVHHLKAAVGAMQELMVGGLRSAGYSYVDQDWEFRGPYSHVAFSEDSSPEAPPPGLPTHPDAFDPEEWRRWERAEKSRVARKLGLAQEMVDYELVATFERRVRGPMGVIRTQRR